MSYGDDPENYMDTDPIGNMRAQFNLVRYTSIGLIIFWVIMIGWFCDYTIEYRKKIMGKDETFYELLVGYTIVIAVFLLLFFKFVLMDIFNNSKIEMDITNSLQTGGDFVDLYNSRDATGNLTKNVAKLMTSNKDYADIVGDHFNGSAIKKGLEDVFLKN